MLSYIVDGRRIYYIIWCVRCITIKDEVDNETKTIRSIADVCEGYVLYRYPLLLFIHNLSSLAINSFKSVLLVLCVRNQAYTYLGI